MTMRPHFAIALTMLLAAGPSMQQPMSAQGKGTLSGTADDAARRPYPDYSVRARNVQQGVIAATVPLDAQGRFALTGLDPANYLVELINRDGRVVCTEGPYDLSKQPTRANIDVDCDAPVAWWLLAAAGAAGITAGVIANGPASPSR